MDKEGGLQKQTEISTDKDKVAKFFKNYQEAEAALVRQRIHYVELRTRIKNKIHSVLFKTNTAHSFSNLYGKARMEFLRKLKIRKVYRQELNRYLTTLNLLNSQIDELSETIKSAAKVDYDCQLLMTIPGISFFSA